MNEDDEKNGTEMDDAAEDLSDDLEIEGTRRYRADILLHAPRTQHRDAASVHQEIGEDAAEELDIARRRMQDVKRDQRMSSRLEKLKREKFKLEKFKARALAKPGVRDEYDNLAEEFELLDEILKARAEAGLTQAELAERIGTTQSAIARMETAIGKHSPTIATLRRYAAALGYRVQVRFVKDKRARNGARRGR
ncbi:MAG: helix-turn-helix domain-containing protein [Woeseia sp.]